MAGSLAVSGLVLPVKGRFSHPFLLLVAAWLLKASSGIPVSGSRRMVALSCYADRLFFYVSLAVKFTPEMDLEILGGKSTMLL